MEKSEFSGKCEEAVISLVRVNRFKEFENYAQYAEKYCKEHGLVYNELAHRHLWGTWQANAFMLEYMYHELKKSEFFNQKLETN